MIRLIRLEGDGPAQPPGPGGTGATFLQIGSPWRVFWFSTPKQTQPLRCVSFWNWMGTTSQLFAVQVRPWLPLNSRRRSTPC